MGEIRRAVNADIPNMVRMGRQFIEEDAYAAFIKFNAAAFEQALANLVSAPSGIVFVLEIGGVMKGAILGMTIPHFVSGETALMEVAWWVDPDARGNGGKLLSALEEAGRSAGATSSTVTEPPGNPAVGRIYERYGYKKLETTYMKAL